MTVLFFAIQGFEIIAYIWIQVPYSKSADICIKQRTNLLPVVGLQLAKH